MISGARLPTGRESGLGNPPSHGCAPRSRAERRAGYSTAGRALRTPPRGDEAHLSTPRRQVRGRLGKRRMRLAAERGHGRCRGQGQPSTGRPEMGVGVNGGKGKATESGRVENTAGRSQAPALRVPLSHEGGPAAQPWTGPVTWGHGAGRARDPRWPPALHCHAPGVTRSRGRTRAGRRAELPGARVALAAERVPAEPQSSARGRAAETRTRASHSRSGLAGPQRDELMG